MKVQHDPSWCLKRAILEQVQYEDLVAWARAETPAELPEPEPARTIPFTPASAYAFGRHIFKRSMGILTP